MEFSDLSSESSGGAKNIYIEAEFIFEKEFEIILFQYSFLSRFIEKSGRFWNKTS